MARRRRRAILAAPLAATAVVPCLAQGASEPSLRFHNDLSFGRVVKRDYLHSGIRMTGRIVNTVGQPTGGIPVTVYSSTLGGAYPVPVGSAVTGPDGRYSVSVGNGPPRVLTLEVPGAALVTVRERVSPSVWFRVGHIGQRMAIFGKLFGTTATVVMKDRTPAGWRTFAITVSHGDGTFHLVYRHAPGGRYLMRATTLPHDDWRAGASAVKWG